MYTKRLSRETLLEVEDLLWGNASVGGSIAIAVRPIEVSRPVPSPYKTLERLHNGNYRLVFDATFAGRHRLEAIQGSNDLYGLAYAGYGLDEYNSGKQTRTRRYCVTDGEWALELRCQPIRFRGHKIPAAVVMQQAQAALWLLTAFGGVGSRSHNGFGSFQVPSTIKHLDPKTVSQLSDEFMQWAQLNQARPEDLSGVPGLGPRGIFQFQQKTAVTDGWRIVDWIGRALQDFASNHKHNQDKVVLGLPRKIHGPLNHPLGHQDPAKHKPPIYLASGKAQGPGGRHPAAIFFSIDRGGGGSIARVTAMPDKHLRPRNSEDCEHYRRFLLQFLGAVQKYLRDNPLE